MMKSANVTVVEGDLLRELFEHEGEEAATSVELEKRLELEKVLHGYCLAANAWILEF